jgi:uncharacterized BrkB/YihY/UPF0761 family membrane protein
LLVWLWLTNVALFFGAEINAEIARRSPASETRLQAEDGAQGIARRSPASETTLQAEDGA